MCASLIHNSRCLIMGFGQREGYTIGYNDKNYPGSGPECDDC